MSDLQVISDEQWLLVKRTLMDTDKIQYTDDEFKLFVNQAKRTGLDPFTRQIYATKTGGKMTVQATIDGLRLIAQRSGLYEGQTRPIWFDEDGKEYRVWPKSKGNPYACEVGVYKQGFKEPLYAMAIFDEYCAMSRDFKTQQMKIGFMWSKMPSLMIAKVAEALALRKAFPNDMSGIYSTEEISVNENEITDKTHPNETSKQLLKEVQEKCNEPITVTKNPLINESELKEETKCIPKPMQAINPNDSEAATTKEPERFPRKEQVNINKEQAEFLMQAGYKYGHTREEILHFVYQLTKKVRFGEVNLKEYEEIINLLEQNRKERK